MVPNGWIHTTFEKHIDCLTGYAFKSSNYSDSSSDIKLLRGDNIEPGSLRWRDAKYWSINQLDGLERYQLNKGDFVIALDRTWISSGLKVAEVRSEDLPCLLVQRVIRVRAKKTLEQGLLRQYFSGHKFEQYVKSVQTATAVPHISPNDIKEFPLLLPPLAEQQKIAQILSTWDQAISATEKLLENSQQQKKALMQQLLTGKKRLLDENGVRFHDEWNQVLVSEICHIGRGRVISKTEIEENKGTFPVYSSQTLHNGVMGYLNSYDFDGEVVTWTTDGVNAGTVFYRTGKFNCTNVCGTLTPKKSSIDLKFLAFSLSRETYKYVSHTLANPKLMNGVMGTISLKIPSFKEQQKIAKIILVADKEIETLQKKLDCLKQEKKALMQQLLTGKKRVKVAD